MARSFVTSILRAARTIAPQMPSGLDDPRSLDKLRGEQAELAEALAADDQLGAYTEVVDVLYYVGKALHNGLITEAEAEAAIQAALNVVNLPLARGLAALNAKYQSRIALGKDHAAERAAVAAAVSEKRGGAGRGQGRKAGPHAPYEQRSVQLSARVWAFVAWYKLLSGAASENAALEQVIRSHPCFVPEPDEQHTPPFPTGPSAVLP
ncbi:MAG: hypothetical protein WCG26_14805 [Chloroflexales bacterium]